MDESSLLERTNVCKSSHQQSRSITRKSVDQIIISYLVSLELMFQPDRQTFVSLAHFDFSGVRIEDCAWSFSISLVLNHKMEYGFEVYFYGGRGSLWLISARLEG